MKPRIINKDRTIKDAQAIAIEWNTLLPDNNILGLQLVADHI